MTTSTVIKYNPYDLLTAIGTEVVESHLRLVYSDESLYIDALAAAAVRAVEAEANLYHGTGTVSFKANCIPTSWSIPVDAARFIPTGVEYLNTSGEWTTLDATKYHMTTQKNPMLFVHDSAVDPEDLDTDAIESFRINGTVSSVDMPAHLEQACLLMLAHLYQNREAVVNEKVYDLPLAFTYLIGKSRNNPLRG
jgi:uncharacterized phiE125 gp8 family phage protein